MSRVLPILFNTEMVQAILDGRKTVTRRKIDADIVNSFDIDTDGSVYGCQNRDGDFENAENFCRYHPGDILYVRETWAWEPCWDCGLDMGEGGCAEESVTRIYNQKKREYGCYCYKASMEDGEELSVDTWHPSIHMPKAAARIWLMVTDVRVERLQEMTASESAKEGIQLSKQYDTNERAYILKFADVWDSTIKKSDQNIYGWEANPWVWVIEFERCEKPESESGQK